MSADRASGILRRLRSVKGDGHQIWSKGNAAFGRVLAGFIANDRGGTRTLDQRINLPHRLSPTTLHLDSASRRIRKQGVDGLDYLFAIAGVPRLVSGAGAGDPLVPCLLITQSPAFQTLTPAVASHVVVRGLSGRSSILRHSLVAVRFLPARGSFATLLAVLEVRCSTD